MIIYYISLFLAVILIGVQNCLMKVYQTKVSSAAVFSFLFNAGLGLGACFLFLVLNGFQLQVQSTSVWIALAMCIGITANNILAIKVVAFGKVSIFTLFLMLGGMICPFLYGVRCLQETAGVWRWIALFLLIISMFVVGHKDGMKDKTCNKGKFYLFCLCTFFSNGLVSIMSKMHQVMPDNSATNDFLIVMYAMLFLINICIFGIMYFIKVLKKEKENIAITKKKWLRGIALMFFYAIISGVAFFIQVNSAIHLPATVLYPIVTGGTIVVTALLGRVFFKEKISAFNLIGLAIVLGATCLFLLP